MNVEDRLLLLGASMRLTRVAVADDIGRWYLADPLQEWAKRHEGADVDEGEEPRGWRTRLASGIDCPYCVGFWIGTLVLIGYHLLPRWLWRFGARALTLNEMAAHLGVRLGDIAED